MAIGGEPKSKNNLSERKARTQLEHERFIAFVQGFFDSLLETNPKYARGLEADFKSYMDFTTPYMELEGDEWDLDDNNDMFEAAYPNNGWLPIIKYIKHKIILDKEKRDKQKDLEALQAFEEDVKKRMEGKDIN